MADVKFSDLPAASALDGTEVLAAVQGGDSVQTTSEAVAALAVALGYVVPLFDDTADAANVTTTKTALYDHIIPAGTLAANGDKLVAEFVGKTAANGNNKTISVNFGGVEILNTGALTINNKDWLVRVTVWRKSNTTARALAEFVSDGVAPKVKYTDESVLTGFDFAATGSHLILYGQSGTASADITATSGRVVFEGAA